MKSNFFESLGKSMDKDLQEFRESVGWSRKESSSQKDVSVGDAVRDLLQRAGQDVVIQCINEEFEYNDLIAWVHDHAVGNKFYVVKAHLENKSDSILCVFFGEDDSLLVDLEYPKICYVFKRLNPTLEDLFPEGKNVYVKSIKIIK